MLGRGRRRCAPGHDSLPAEAQAAAADTERVRTFIGKRKAEILADLNPAPPEWPEQRAAGVTLAIGEGALAGAVWSIPPGASAPDSFSPFTEGALELSAAQTTSGATIAGQFETVDAPTPGAANQP